MVCLSRVTSTLHFRRTLAMFYKSITKQHGSNDDWHGSFSLFFSNSDCLSSTQKTNHINMFPALSHSCPITSLNTSRYIICLNHLLIICDVATDHGYFIIYRYYNILKRNDNVTENVFECVRSTDYCSIYLQERVRHYSVV